MVPVERLGDVRSQNVATCRQTVEAFLARRPPLGSGWLRFLERSHLSPDGGGLSRPAVHRLAADGYAWQRMATLGSGWLHLAADGYDSTHLVDFVVL